MREIWTSDGEPAYRRLESKALADALLADQPTVIAAAGGVVLDPGNRDRLRRAGTVVWLDADPDVLVGRAVSGDHRPLLDDDPDGRTAANGHRQAGAVRGGRRRARRRHPAGAGRRDRAVLAIAAELADGGPADGRSPDDRRARAAGSRSERAGSYDVVVGSGARDLLPERLPAGVRRAAVVTQDGIPVEVDPGVPCDVVTVPDGEAAKQLTVVEDLARAFARFGLTRGDVVVGVGGGVVTDLAGFAAAVYHRGVPVVHVPTTLLGQVDAAIGGKTGVNLPEGKNLVGAFWQPSAVLCDTDVLSTLPPREQASGAGEMAKYHFLDRRRPVRVAAWTSASPSACASRLRSSRSDEREGGRRAILNYGHTLAHALETAGHYDLRHGEAVAIGLVYAAELARVLGRIDDDRVSAHRRGGRRATGCRSSLPDRRRPRRAGQAVRPGQEGGDRRDLRARRSEGRRGRA